MVKTYKKGVKTTLSDYFVSTEFDCKCRGKHCSTTYIDSDLIDLLDKLRTTLNTPLKIQSGFRCTAHNSKVGGKPGSFHLQGKAADIVAGNLKKLYSESLKLVGLSGGIGKYKTWIHVDVRGYKARWQG